MNCLHCAKCCSFNEKKCRFLAGNLCRIYKKRIGVWTGLRDNKGNKIYCGYRKNSLILIDGCPYNEIIQINLDNVLKNSQEQP